MNIKQLVRNQILQMGNKLGDVRMIIPYGYYGEKIKILQDIQKAIENELYKINLYPSPTKQVLKEARV